MGPVRGVLANCRSAALQFGDTKVEAAIHQLTFPRLGHISSAYAWAVTLAGIRLGFDLVLFQARRYYGYLSYADLGQPATATVEAFARAAIAKRRAAPQPRYPTASRSPQHRSAPHTPASDESDTVRSGRVPAAPDHGLRRHDRQLGAAVR